MMGHEKYVELCARMQGNNQEKTDKFLGYGQAAGGLLSILLWNLAVKKLLYGPTKSGYLQ
jgi:hypothetical protein